MDNLGKSGGEGPSGMSMMSYVEDQDNDCTSACFKGMRHCGGGVYTVMCLPCGCCGSGPIIKVEEGFRAAVLKHGKLHRIVGPGTYHYNIGTEQYLKKSVQILTLDVPRQSVITKDNLTVVINAVVYYQVFDLKKALFNVKDCDTATSNFAQSTLRTVIGENTLDELFSRRMEINERLTELIDIETDKWGVKITGVEMKDIVIPEKMQRVMASVAEAHREGAAKIITAEAELKAANTLAEAADIMSTNPIALQLRYFQTLGEIANEKNSTIIVPSGIASGIFGGGGGGGGGSGMEALGGGGSMPIDLEKTWALRRQLYSQRAERAKLEQKMKEQELEKAALLMKEGEGKLKMKEK